MQHYGIYLYLVKSWLNLFRCGIAYFYGPPKLMPDQQRWAHWWTECPPVCRVLFRRLGWMMHICISKLTTISSDNGLSPVRCQSITWTCAGLLSIELLETSFSEIWIRILSFSFKKMHLKCHLPQWRPFCPGGDELINMLRPGDAGGTASALHGSGDELVASSVMSQYLYKYQCWLSIGP